MITDKWLIDNGFEYSVLQDGGFWYLKDEEDFYPEIYQVSEDRSVVQYYNGLETFDMSDEGFMDQVKRLGKLK